MSDIKVGDLVMKIKPTLCCGNLGSVGKIHTVTSEITKPFSKCFWCGEIRESSVDEVCLSDGNVCEKSRLLKIDPPALDESTESERELTA